MNAYLPLLFSIFYLDNFLQTIVAENHKTSVIPTTIKTVETAFKKKSSVKTDVRVSLKNEPANSSAWKGKNKWWIFVHI